MWESKLKEFGKNIDRLIRGESLSKKDMKEMFCQILLNEQPEIHQGAFLAALSAKGLNSFDISAAFEAIYELDTEKVELGIEPVVDNCGTGMDSIKTFNVSTVSAIIGAAGGVFLARHGARAISSKCGTVDVSEAMGVCVECEVEVVKRSILKTRLGLFNGMSRYVHPRALFRILSKIRFGTVLNIAASLANPALPKYGVRGVYSASMVPLVADVMKEIGYKRALVFHGLNGDKTKGMDEISPIGETIICELRDGRISTYKVYPEDFGLSNIREEDLLAQDSKEIEALKIVRILVGKDKGPRYIAACLNASPIFYIANKAKDLKEGFFMAAEIVDSKKALYKLFEWVKEQNTNPEEGEKRLDYLVSKANDDKFFKRRTKSDF